MTLTANQACHVVLNPTRFHTLIDAVCDWDGISLYIVCGCPVRLKVGRFYFYRDDVPNFLPSFE